MSRDVSQEDGLALEINTPTGVLRATLRVPPRPMRLPELAMSFLGFSSKLTDRSVLAVTQAGKEISCRKGCGACCRQVVPLSPPEAWMIADVVASLPAEKQSAVRATFRDADAKLATVKDALLGDISSIDRMLALTVEYFRLGVPCPFLVDESCSIHPVRPSICREYLVTSPAQNCAELGTAPIERVPPGIRLSEALSSLTGKLLGRPPQVIPLVFALEWAEANRADGARTWDARELIQGLVAEVSSASA